MTDRAIRGYNRRYLAHDRPTDVIAFDSVGPGHFGDILISLDTARRQARGEGHPLLTELKILAIHGLLHLLGYDDRRKRDRERMWRKTEALLRKVERF